MSYNPTMLQDYYVARLRQCMAQRAARLASLKTRKDAEQYRATVRKKIRAIFSPWPKRTPLNARIIGRVERKTYSIENIIFQSRPGLFVTANLYLPHPRPRSHPRPYPCVLGACGHSGNGKAWPAYQSYARNLANQGYIVLIYDPISQGDRDQFAHLPKPMRVEGCVLQHQMLGHQMGLCGQYFGAWRTWDATRALDYLLSRPEVDKTRVGLTGNSGGGTLSTHLTALDDRLTMVAASCFVTTSLSNLENELPTDSEQIPPNLFKLGLDAADFFIARAPRPTLLIGQQHCFFDERGLRQTFDQVRRIYRMLGHENNVALYIGPGDHGYHADGRQAMYQFFNRFAKNSAPGNELRTPLESDQTLSAAPRGQVANIPANRFVHDFTRQTATNLATHRPKLSDKALRDAIVKTLQLPKRKGVPHHRVLRPIYPTRDHAYRACNLFQVETEVDIQAALFLWQRGTAKSPPTWQAQLPAIQNATVYLPHVSSEDDIRNNLSPVSPPQMYSIDPRGMGRSQPRTCGDSDFFLSYGADCFYTAHGLMFGESLLGRRVHDVLTTLDLLKAVGTKHVHLIGRGLGSVIATFAACLHPTVNRVTLKNGLKSFMQVTQTPHYNWPLSSLPWNVLSNFDLPDCYRLLKAKRLRQIEPWGPSMGGHT